MNKDDFSFSEWVAALADDKKHRISDEMHVRFS